MTLPVERPSLTLVHTDKRGELYSIRLPGGRELMLLHSKAGSLRGGHSHDVPETVMVLTGKLVYHKLIEGYEVTSELREGDVEHHEAYRVHMGEFPEDTYLIEWKVGKSGPRNIDYAPFRELVRANAASA